MQPAEYDFTRKVQTQILAMIVRNPDFMTNYPGVVRAEFFTDDVNAIIAREYIKRQDGTYTFDAGMLYDMVSRAIATSSEKAMTRTVRRRIRTLFGLEIHEKFLLEEAIKFSKHQRIVSAYTEGVDMLRAGDYTKLEKHLTEAFQSPADMRMDLGTEVFSSNPKDAFKKIDSRRIPTGYPSIDGLTEGGLSGGELGLVIGPPGRGKSLVCMDMAANIALKSTFTVVIFTLEMREERYLIRFYSRIANKSRQDVRRDPESVRKLLRVVSKNSKSKIYVKGFPAKSATTETIHAYIRMMKNNGIRPDIVFVDYADLLRPREKRSDKRLELDDIHVELRSIAQVEDVPIWTPTQGNRKSMSSTVIDLDGIAEDFSKGMTCDFAMALCQTLAERHDSRMRVFIAKNRNERDKVSFGFTVDYERMRFHDEGVEE